MKRIEKLLEGYTKHFEAKSEGADSTGGFLYRLTPIISTAEEDFDCLAAVSLDKKKSAIEISQNVLQYP